MNSRKTTGSASPTDTARTRSGSTVATARRIPSAIRRLELERSRLDACLALAGCRCERPLPRTQSGNGVAARRVGGTDGEESAGAAGARSGRSRPAICLRCCCCCCPSPSWWPSSNGNGRYRSAPAWLSIAFGIFRLVDRRHPRALARIPPTQLGLWSFAVAIAHGAGLMLVPIYLGLCRDNNLDRGHEAAGSLINANLGVAVLVSVVHATAMIAAGGCTAWLVYRYLGLKFLSRSWFNLDATWAVSLILVGTIALVLESRELGRSCCAGLLAQLDLPQWCLARILRVQRRRKKRRPIGRLCLWSVCLACGAGYWQICGRPSSPRNHVPGRHTKPLRRA